MLGLEDRGQDAGRGRVHPDVTSPKAYEIPAGVSVMSKSRFVLPVALVLACAAAKLNAAIVTFTGGVVTRLDASTETTNNIVTWDDVDYYEEAGFKLDFLPNSGSAGFATHVGNYYNAGNDVIHSHWATGSFGQVTTVEVTKIGGGTFDLNYFVLTSNTERGGGPATGNERAFVEGFNSNVSTGPAVLLPPEDWGFPATAIFLGSNFDLVDKVVFYVENHVDCFGMDEFYIDQPAPTGSVPEATSLVGWSLLGLCVAVIGWYRKSS